MPARSCSPCAGAAANTASLPGAQGFVGTADEAPFTVPTWGHATAAGVVTVVDPVARAGVYTTLWADYSEAAPVLLAESDFAHMRRPPPQLPAYSGRNDAVGLSDLSTTDVALGWDVAADPSLAGGTVIPLFNFLAPGAPLPPTTVLFGQVFEVDLGDPLITVLADVGYGGPLDASGRLDNVRRVFPSTGPSLIGGRDRRGVHRVRAGVLGVAGTTQAVWTEIR